VKFIKKLNDINIDEIVITGLLMNNKNRFHKIYVSLGDIE
jgi:hypothetical protein